MCANFTFHRLAEHRPWSHFPSFAVASRVKVKAISFSQPESGWIAYFLQLFCFRTRMTQGLETDSVHTLLEFNEWLNIYFPTQFQVIARRTVRFWCSLISYFESYLMQRGRQRISSPALLSHLTTSISKYSIFRSLLESNPSPATLLNSTSIPNGS